MEVRDKKGNKGEKRRGRGIGKCRRERREVGEFGGEIGKGRIERREGVECGGRDRNGEKGKSVGRGIGKDRRQRKEGIRRLFKEE